MSTTSVHQGVKVIKAYVKTLSETPGVYRMLGVDDAVLYVGKAKNLKKRVTSYTRPEGQSLRIQRMIGLTKSMAFVVCDSESAALVLEATLIKKLKPRFNVLMRDDKTFPYLVITKDHDAPQLLKHRGAKTILGTYFGPFVSTSAVNKSLETLTKIFQLRTCSDHVFKNRSRPCLQYHIKRCAAPCVGLISDAEYGASVRQAKDFLQGQTKHIQKDFAKKMHTASDAQKYEEAALLRDRLQALNFVQEHQYNDMPLRKNVDVFAIFTSEGQICIEVFFFRNGVSYGNKSYFPIGSDDLSDGDILQAYILQFYQRFPLPEHILLNQDMPELPLLEEGLQTMAGHKVVVQTPKRGTLARIVQEAYKNATLALSRKIQKTVADKAHMEAVAKLFSCPSPIKRIEVYDNSHLFGTAPKGAMIVAGPEGFQKNAYRQFRIQGSAGPLGDDYGMMREVFQRRFKDSDASQWPDLIIIDGGKGQLTAARETLNNMGVSLTLVAMGKGPNRHAGEEWFYQHEVPPFQLPKDSMTLYYLQRLRDESHRFVIGAHRQARQKKSRGSILDEVPGLGPKRKKALLNHFGSVQRVQDASIKELAKAPGIHQSIATSVYAYFHND